VIIEIKTRLDDIGAVERQVGWYERNATGVARALGWQPARILSWLLLLASDEVELTVRLQRQVLRRSFPSRASALRQVIRDPRTAIDRRGLAMIDPRSRRHDWLIPTRSDGRRSAAPYRDYGEAARRLAAPGRS
jgi:hypothetical protein